MTRITLLLSTVLLALLATNSAIAQNVYQTYEHYTLSFNEADKTNWLTDTLTGKSIEIKARYCSFPDTAFVTALCWQNPVI